MRQRIGSLATILIMSISLLFAAGRVSSEEKKWIIIQTSGDSLADCSLDSLAGSRLWFHRNSGPESIELDSLLILFSPGRSHGIEGLLLGAAAGGTIGYFAAGDPYVEQHTTHFFFTWHWTDTHDPRPGATMLGAAIGGALGYFIGANTGGEKCYEFFTDSPQKKALTVRAILLGSR